MLHLLYVGYKELEKKDKDLSREIIFNKKFLSSKFKNKLYNIFSSSRPLQYIVCSLFFLYSLLKISKSKAESDFITSVYNDNEIKIFNKIDTKYNILNIKKKIGLDTNLKILFQIPMYKTLKIIHNICFKKNNQLYVNLRSVEYFAYYFSFHRVIKHFPKTKFITLTDNNPSGICFFKLTEKFKIKNYFISHGESLEPSSKVTCSSALLYSKNSLEIYNRHNSRIDQIFFWGCKKDHVQEVELPSKNLTAGLFLSKYTSIQGLNESLKLILNTFPVKQFVIRPHPNYSNILSNYKNTQAYKILPSLSLGQDISNCDIIFAANSSVHIDALAQNVTSIYIRYLDDQFYDRNQFVKNNILLDFDKIKNWHEIKDFYFTKDFYNRFANLYNTTQSRQDSFDDFIKSLES